MLSNNKIVQDILGESQKEEVGDKGEEAKKKLAMTMEGKCYSSFTEHQNQQQLL